MPTTREPTAAHLSSPTPGAAAHHTRVTAIVSTHNRARYLAEALDSLLAQTRPLDELIVIDDASSDGTRELLETRYADRVRLILFDDNQGKAAALNAAIPEAIGDYLWLFDDDDIALPDALERHAARLDAGDTLDFTYSSTYHSDQPENIYDERAWHINEAPDVAPERFLLETLLGMQTLMQGMLISRAALLDIGLFDTELRRCQDLDILLRLAAAHRGARLDAPTFVYREHDGARGGGHATHAVEQRFRVQDEYRKQVFRKIRTLLPLPIYLRHLGERPSVFTPPARDSAALIQRGAVFLRQGLVAEGLADLKAGFEAPAAEQIDPNWVAENMALALDVEPWMFDDAQALVNTLASLLARRDDTAAARSVARGFYWSLRRELGLGRRAQAARAGSLLARFGGRYLAARLRRTITRSSMSS